MVSIGCSHVDTAEQFGRGLGDQPRRARLGQIGLDEKHIGIGCQFDLQRLTLGHQHPRTSGQQFFGNAATDAATAAGHHSIFSLEQHIRLLK